MKKNTLSILFILISILFSFTACSNNTSSSSKKIEDTTIVVGASTTPHSEILKACQKDLEKEGYKLKVIEFSDYVKPNLALSEKEIFANYFQHKPYLDNFNKEHNLDLVSIGNIHVEPMGIYSSKISSLSNLKDGSTISIPSDAVNGARALILLESTKLIKLNPKSGLNATEKDILENPHKFNFKALDAASLARTLSDVDISIITGNYALEANLNPIKDALLLEGKDSPYANIITIRKDDINTPKAKALIKSLHTKNIKNFILNKYNGAVVPAF